MILTEQDLDNNPLSGDEEPVNDTELAPEENTEEEPIDETMPEEKPPVNSPIGDVLNTLSGWMDSMDSSNIMDAAIDGAEILNNNSERSNFNYISKAQYSAFQKIIKSTQEVLTSISGLSNEAKKILDDIELSRKLMTTQKQESKKKNFKEDVRTHKSEFPQWEIDSETLDFVESNGFEDSSWHNDEYPSFEKEFEDGSLVRLNVNPKNKLNKFNDEHKYSLIFYKDQESTTMPVDKEDEEMLIITDSLDEVKHAYNKFLKNENSEVKENVENSHEDIYSFIEENGFVDKSTDEYTLFEKETDEGHLELWFDLPEDAPNKYTLLYQESNFDRSSASKDSEEIIVTSSVEDLREEYEAFMEGQYDPSRHEM